MTSFDVNSLFTNVLLDEAISIILRKIFVEGKIETNIPRSVTKELLLLCTKHIHFIYSVRWYGYESLLGPLLTNVFICSLEESIVQTLKDCLIH